LKILIEIHFQYAGIFITGYLSQVFIPKSSGQGQAHRSKRVI